MKLKAVKAFADRECDMTLRQTGDVFDADKPRADYLIRLGFAVEEKKQAKEKILAEATE